MVSASFLEAAGKILWAAEKHPFSSDEERGEKAILLAGLLLQESTRVQTRKERKQQESLARLLSDQKGKVFLLRLTDQCFRSSRNSRIADQVVHLLNRYGMPQFLLPWQKACLYIFKFFAKMAPFLFVPLMKTMMIKELEGLVLPGEPGKLEKEIKKRSAEGIRVNLNHIGEAILGEKEAKKRLTTYLEDLSKEEVEVISVKISSISSRIKLLALEETLSILSERLAELYRVALPKQKLVNLDMEEYRDLHITLDLFQRVLDQKEFFHLTAGIVLQSYLPDSFSLQKKLTTWAMERVKKGGAPICLRIVKGANLAMEELEASMQGWTAAPYPSKENVDANFKKMLTYGCKPEHAKAVQIGVASHNLFDIAYALLLRAENGLEKQVHFEMLGGMADHQRRVVQSLAKEMLLYCPAAARENFHSAVAYLVRRLDENTAPHNFLRNAFGLKVGSSEWKEQAEAFLKSCRNADSVSFDPRRTEKRKSFAFADKYHHEPDIDFAKKVNQEWVKKSLAEFAHKKTRIVPLVVSGEFIKIKQREKGGIDPSCPGNAFYTYTVADESLADKSLACAKKSQQSWGYLPMKERSRLLFAAAEKFRERRGELIAAMVADTGKVVLEADPEVTEAIDFLEYYRRNAEELFAMKDLTWTPKGVVLVTPPWNFPCSIPVGGIAAALAAGNSVIFKPAPQAVLVGFTVAKLFWEAGISPEVLQFLPCEDEPVGSQLIKDPRVDAILLTGGFNTARHFLALAPGISLIGELGGKNSIIVTSLSDRDLAVKDIVKSAFLHAGQKCSACSLAILEKEVYHSLQFREQLCDAAESLKVGSAWDLDTDIGPLIDLPNERLKCGLSVLEEGEEWLLAPKNDPENPQLFTPGIKIGVTQKSTTYKKELFGPVLSVMCAENMEHALQLANGTEYGLTAGLQTLDDREREFWLAKIEAGNCYINRGITGAIVERQPFGGWKHSQFGPGGKAGGPNFVLQLLHPQQKGLPEEQEAPPECVGLIRERVAAEELKLFDASVGSYSFYWKSYFSKGHDPSNVRGQDNIFRYVPHDRLILRLMPTDAPIDFYRFVAAAFMCGAKPTISGTVSEKGFWKSFNIEIVEESEDTFAQRVSQGEGARVRFLGPIEPHLLRKLHKNGVYVYTGPVLANGRIELLHYLKEQSISFDYHRYGNLGMREETLDADERRTKGGSRT